MKKMIFAAMALVAVSLASCSKDNEPKDPATGDNVVVVKLPDNVVPGTRAVEAPVATNSNTTLTDVTVFLLNGIQVVAKVDFAGADITAKYKRIENVSPSVNGVLVVANIPATDVAAVKALTNATDIKNYAFTVADQNEFVGIATQTLMSEVVAATEILDPNPDGHKYKKAEVTLNALTARFEIGKAVAGTGIATVEIDGVWVNGYYITNAKVVAEIKNHPSTDPVWIIAQTEGASATPFTKPTFASYTEAAYSDKGDATVDAATKVYAYQVFAGANIPQVILCVRGQYTTEQTVGGNDKEFLGWVTFNKYLDGGTPIPTVVANLIYKLGNVTINADMITIKPNLEAFDLGINVILTPWTEKNVTPGV